MKTFSCRPVAIIAVSIFAALATLEQASAALLTETASYTPNLMIPDGSTIGIADAHTFSSAIATISEVRVSLRIDGEAFNGDFYAYLTHGTGFSVLINRPGRTAGTPFGYADSGFNVTFDDKAPNGDIHIYQNIVNPNGGPLTGLWQPDARDVYPGLAVDTTPRTAFLSSFDGLDPNGQWTLFAADVSPLGTGVLASWELEITGVIPEPGTNYLLGLGLLLMLAGRRWRMPLASAAKGTGAGSSGDQPR